MNAEQTMKPLVAILVFCFCLCLAGCGGGSSQSQSVSPVSPPPTTPQAVSMEVVDPPAGNALYSSDVQTYLMTQSAVTGASLFLSWSSVDQGPTVSPQYDFSSADNLIQPWIAAGKKANLIVWAVADAFPTNFSTPQYVLNNLASLGETTSCTSTSGTESDIPDYFDQTNFQQPYQAFMKALIQHYTGNTSVGYIRFGLGRGGESLVALGFGSDPVCTTALDNWGYTDSNWTNYLISMLDFEKTLNSPIQLLVASNTNSISVSDADSVAAEAVKDGIGIGNEGFQLSDITSYSAGQPCTGDWCNLFNLYTGQVPLELQTVSQSNPDGAAPTGSLVTLLPFAVQRHATILELYWEDWLTAFDPNYPGYDASYAQAIQSAGQGQ
jgi:hypothetical protein